MMKCAFTSVGTSTEDYLYREFNENLDFHDIATLSLQNRYSKAYPVPAKIAANRCKSPAQTPYIRKDLNPNQHRHSISEAEQRALRQWHHEHSDWYQKQLRACFLKPIDIQLASLLSLKV